MQKIPCEIIRDLFPSYIDGLTSVRTNQEVEAHIKTCEPCKTLLEQMQAPETKRPAEEVKEIDFLKKTKRQHKKQMVLCVLLVWAMAVAVLLGKSYVVGQELNPEYLIYHLDVAETELNLAVNTIAGQGIQDIVVQESEGIVRLTVQCVPKSFFYKPTATTVYLAPEPIHQVWIGDRIVWAEGESISPLTSGLYAAYHPYVGDMSANGKVITALNMTAYTGAFTNELRTAEKPYIWKLIFEKDFSTMRQKDAEEQLKYYAYLILSQIGNLDEVCFAYTVDGEAKTLSVTCQGASDFAGADIKTIGTDVSRLEALVRKTGLLYTAWGKSLTETNAETF